MRHIEPFLHGGDAADDAFVLRPPIFTLIQRPYLYHQKPLVFWQFWEITQSPLYFGEIENISHLHVLQIKVTLYRNVATNVWTNLHALTQKPLLFACSCSPNTLGLAVEL